MTLDTIRRRRVPIGLALILLALWLATGIRRADREGGQTVLDSPLGLIRPRPVGPGWHLAPAGLLRLSDYPIVPATFSFSSGGNKGPPLVSQEGIQVVASGTIRYSIEPDRVLDVHRSLGPGYEQKAVARWVQEVLRDAVGSSRYVEISGAHTEELRVAVGQSLAERFRAAGLVLLSCDLGGVQIRSSEPGKNERAGRATGMRVLLVGLDGADWNILDPLIASGKLPNIGRLARSGVRGRLHTITPMLSPVIWTSVATGVLPGRHGIIDFLATTGREGERVPVTSDLRKTEAIWNILSDHDLRVGVTGWWATYPAERVKGFIVSDRVAYQLFGHHPGRDQARDGRAFPPEIDPLVASLVVPPETIGVQQVSRYVRLSADPVALPADRSKLIDDFKTLLAAGDTYTAISLALGERFRPQFQAVYLEGTDTVGHLFMRYAPPLLQGVDRIDAQMFGRTVDEYYRHADELVGRLVEAAGPGTAIILCSDHGFRTGDNRPLTDSRIGYGQAADWHRKYGVVILHGPPFRKGHELSEASVLDITPTILALFGLPVAEDMDGRPIVDAFEEGFLRDHPITYTPTYETGLLAGASQPASDRSSPLSPLEEPRPSVASPPARDPQGDEELKERLASLGYLRQDSANSHNNRGMLLMQKGKYDEAIAEFERSIEASESLGVARLNLARAHFRKKDYDRALEAIRDYLARQPRSKEAEDLLGNIAMERGDARTAEAHFKRALEYEPNFTDARNSLGLLYDRQGRLDEAVREFRGVLEIDKDYAEAFNNLGVIYKKQGRLDEAAEEFRKAIAADPNFAGSYSNLALILEQKGDWKGAEEQFKKCLRRDAKNVAALANFGGLLYSVGRFDQARVELEKAVSIDPSYASAHNNLGAVYGKLGRGEEEIASYRRAIAIDPDYADARHNLGLALLKRGSAQEGEDELRRALEADQRYGAAYVQLGLSLLARGATQEALKILTKGVREVPGDADLQAALGETWLALEETEKALVAFEQSLRLKPDQAVLRQKVRSLRGEPSVEGEQIR
jgi:Tfp pilus assembly protein PilF